MTNTNILNVPEAVNDSKSGMPTTWFKCKVDKPKKAGCVEVVMFGKTPEHPNGEYTEVKKYFYANNKWFTMTPDGEIEPATGIHRPGWNYRDIWREMPPQHRHGKVKPLWR